MVVWPHTTTRGMAQSNPWWGGRSASQPPGPTTGCHHQMPPSTGTIPQHTQDNRLAPPSTLTGAHTHHHQHTPKNHKPARENSLPPHTSSPHVPHTHSSPHTTLPQGYHWPTEAGGQHPHEARPARPHTEEGSTGQSHARDEEKGQKWWGGASKHAQQGPWDRGRGTGLQAASGDHKDTRNTAKPPGKPAGGPTTTHTQRQSHDTPGTPTGPSQPQSRPPQPSPTTRASEAPKPIFHHPSSTDSFSI